MHQYWDALYRADPDYFGTAASSLARFTLGLVRREFPTVVWSCVLRRRD